MSSRLLLAPRRHPLKRAVTLHAVERLRARPNSVDYACRSDDDLRYLLDDAVDEALQTRRGENLFDTERSHDFALVDISEWFPLLHAVVCKNEGRGTQSQAIVTLTKHEWRGAKLKAGIWTQPLLLQDAEAERHLQNSSTSKLNHRPLEAPLKVLADAGHPPLALVTAPEPEAIARPTPSLLVEFGLKLTARKAEIKDQIEALSLELQELERVQILKAESDQ